MYVILKLIRKFIMIITSQQGLWQIAGGVWIGTILGMSSWWTLAGGLNYLTILLFLLALFVRFHLGSVFMFLAIGKLIALGLASVILDLGHDRADGFARMAAEVPLLHACHFSSTQQLGSLMLAIPLGLVFALVMTWAAHLFETKLREKIMQRKKLLAAGKVAGNTLVMRIGCWFLGL